MLFGKWCVDFLYNKICQLCLSHPHPFNATQYLIDISLRIEMRLSLSSIVSTHFSCCCCCLFDIRVVVVTELFLVALLVASFFSSCYRFVFSHSVSLSQSLYLSHSIFKCHEISAFCSYLIKRL